MESRSSSQVSLHQERLDPNERNDHLAAQHWVRYEWACQFLPAKRVLDCACGLGYGSALLRERGAEQVVGVDNNSDALEYANRVYSQPGVEYKMVDATSLSAEDMGTFNLIVSLETIEHTTTPPRVLDVFRELLEPGGVLVLSCPNDKLLAVANPFHLSHPEFGDLQKWLTQRFCHVACYAEVHVVGSAVWPIEELPSRSSSSRLYMLKERLMDSLPITSAAGFLFACSDTEILPVAPVAAELLDGIGYVRELEKESQRLASEWETVAARVRELEAAAEKLEQQPLFRLLKKLRLLRTDT